MNITTITSVQMLNETYTIPDNLKPFTRTEETSYDAVDMIPLVLRVKERSALNAFSSLNHDKPQIEEKTNGECICRMKVENSIEFMLRMVQCGTSVEIMSPGNVRDKYKNLLKSILSIYKS